MNSDMSIDFNALGNSPSVNLGGLHLNDQIGNDIGSQPSRLAALAYELMEVGRVALFKSNTRNEIVEYNTAFQQLMNKAGAKILLDQLNHYIRRVMINRKNLMRPITLEINGRIRHYDVQFTPVLGEDQTLMGVAGTLQNWTAGFERIEEAQEANLRYVDYARAIADWFWECDQDYRLTMVSDHLELMTGRKPGSMIGQHLSCLGTISKEDHSSDSWGQVLEKQRSFRDLLFHLDRSDGTTRLYHLAGVPVFDSQGRFTGYRGAASDVTDFYLHLNAEQQELRRQESRLSDLQHSQDASTIIQHQAKQSERAQEDFITAINKQLNGPIDTIMRSARSIERAEYGSLDPAYLSYAQGIGEAGRHLNNLVQEMLDLSVINSGHVRLDIAPLQLLLVLEKSYRFCEKQAQDSGIVLEPIVCDPEILVFADSGRLTQIISNLLVNAIKFTPTQGRVGMRVDGEFDPERVNITIWDTGPGIPDQDRDTIFRKFAQIGAERGSVEDGEKKASLGLGLHIARELANLMSGSLILEPPGSVGAEFTLCLPRCMPATP